jgi:hypothetical protein
VTTKIGPFVTPLATFRIATMGAPTFSRSSCGGRADSTPDGNPPVQSCSQRSVFLMELSLWKICWLADDRIRRWYSDLRRVVPGRLMERAIANLEVIGERLQAVQVAMLNCSVKNTSFSYPPVIRRQSDTV